MLRFPHTSDHTLVYITVHTSCEMRLRNDRVGDGGQCKHNVASGSARSGWRSAVWPVGDFFWGYLLDEIQTLCIIHPIYGLPLDPLSVRTHTHTQTMCIYKYKQPRRHNGGIVQNEHVIKWAVSRLLAHPNVLAFCPNHFEQTPNPLQIPPHTDRPARLLLVRADPCLLYVSSCEKNPLSVYRCVCFCDIYLLYSSCSREKMCLLKYSWSFSLA